MSNRSKARIGFFLYLFVLLFFDTKYSFMILNMFLAFAALELSFLLPLFKVKSRREIPGTILIYTLFILMAPNILYVITDLIHLKIFRFNYMDGLAIKEWWNFTVLIAGVLLAVYYHTLIINQLNLLLATVKYRKLCIVVFMMLCSLGIYIGRFLRFHSIHIFTEPSSVIGMVWNSININSMLFILWMFILQIIIYVMFPISKGEEHGH